MNILFQFRLRDFQVIGRAAVFSEEIGGDDIDSGVGALGGQNCRDEQFERVRMLESAVCVGISFAKAFDDLAGSRFLVFDHTR